MSGPVAAGRPLAAVDLDRTLIYSAAALQRHGDQQVPVVAVERYRDTDASFVTRPAAAALARLPERALLVPATTRTPEQLARVTLPGPAPRYAVAANGGVLLVDGRADASWRRRVAAAVGAAASVAEVRAHVERVCAPAWTSAVRTAAELFCYALLDRDAAPPDLVAQEAAWAGPRGWQVSLQGRKLYWVPRALTKSAAVAEIRRREDAGALLAAGDSLLDADLLLAAEAGIVARHGELHASGWRAEQVAVTRREGVRAGEEIADWLLRRAAAPASRGAQTPPPGPSTTARAVT